MVPAGGEALISLPAEAQSPAAARRFAARTLADWDLDPLVDTATLLVSELVTNCLLHARTPMTVRCRRDGDGVRIEVEDGSAVVPRVRRYGSDSATGRGLALVDQLTAAWGTEPTPSGGKKVWFRLSQVETDAVWAAFDLDAVEAI